ncbi:MAG: hypothetical protein AAGL98_13655, partial [Planctomycetota bacterium]
LAGGRPLNRTDKSWLRLWQTTGKMPVPLQRIPPPKCPRFFAINVFARDAAKDWCWGIAATVR